MLAKIIRNYNYIIIVILITGLSTSPFLIVNVNANGPVERLDQEQPLETQGTGIGPGSILAQSFKPTLMKLTRVELLCRRYEENLDGLLEISIRSSLYEDDLTSIFIEAASLPSNRKWVSFDFPNITTVPEKTYFIFFRPVLGKFSWWYHIGDVYNRGMYYDYSPDSWFTHENLDFAFKTYGYGTPGNNPPNQPSKPSGKAILKVDESGIFESYFSDPDGDIVELFFDWGDGTNTGWTGLILNNTAYREHSWPSDGTYEIRTKSRDLPYGDISPWSEPFEVIVDGIGPFVEIINPETAFYIMNFKLFKFRGFLFKKPWIFGRINIEVDARDYSSGMDYVEFYINDRCRAEDHYEPYSWTWKFEPSLICKHVIKAVAYDKAGNSAYNEIMVRKFF